MAGLIKSNGFLPAGTRPRRTHRRRGRRGRSHSNDRRTGHRPASPARRLPPVEARPSSPGVVAPPLTLRSPTRGTNEHRTVEPGSCVPGAFRARWRFPERAVVVKGGLCGFFRWRVRVFVWYRATVGTDPSAASGLEEEQGRAAEVRPRSLRCRPFLFEPSCDKSFGGLGDAPEKHCLQSSLPAACMQASPPRCRLMGDS